MYTIKNSFKQLMRKPGKALLFFLLMAAASMLLVFGGAMYAQSAGRIEAANKLLTTVAFIGQRPVSDNEDATDTEWSDKYMEKKYGDLISPEDLDFPGADYVLKPEPMTYCLAYNPEMKSANRFSETSTAASWLTHIEKNEPVSLDTAWNTIVVAAPKRLDMLYSYSQNKLIVAHGRNITPEEFESGAKVCLVSKSFMMRNLIYEGDIITLPLISASRNTPFPASLREDGEPLEPFYIGEYELVGIFSEGNGANDINYSNCVIIPGNSLEVPEDRFLYTGPMKQWTTACQLQNGGGEEYLHNLREALGEDSERLEVSYNDNGYAQVMESMESAQRTAFLLLAVGLLAGAAIVALLMYFFVIRERRRTAVERSLGLSRRQCRVSILAGLMAMTIGAAALGSAGGCWMLGQSDSFAQLVQAEEEEQEEQVKQIIDWGLGGIFDFSSKYSVWPNRWGVLADLSELEEIAPPTAVFLLVPALLSLMVAVLAAALVNRNLKIEPILVLGAKG